MNHERITIDPDIMFGKPVIMRILGSKGPLAISEIEDALSEDVPRRTLQDPLTVFAASEGGAWIIATVITRYY